MTSDTILPQQAPFDGTRVRHILLVARSFPPLNAVSSLRMYQWAKYWSREGVRVTVLTTTKHWFSGPLDMDVPPLPRVDVVEVEFLPQPLLRLLAGWRRETPADAGQSSAGRARAKPGRLIRIKTWWRRWRMSSRVLPQLEFYDFWVAKAARAGERIIAKDPVDVIVSSFGPPAAHKIGARLKGCSPDTPWVADYRDPWTFSDRFTARGLSGYVERRREEASVGRYADMLVCVSNRLAEQTRRFTARPVIVVENGFDPEEQANPPAFPEAGPATVRAAWAPVTLVYTGTLHPEDQDPKPLLRAIGRLVEEDEAARDGLRVLFFGDRHMCLQQMINDEGVERIVRIMGYVDRPTALWSQRQASALVLIESQASAALGVLRAKMFEYLQTGRPILGVGFGADTEVGRVLVETGVGAVCGVDHDCIGHHLRSLRTHGVLDGFAPNPVALAKYRRDLQAQRLLETMERLLAEPSQAAHGHAPHAVPRASPGGSVEP
jgi:Glycosyltransferase Family 4